jgi:glycosyltransferase involved in cell wall biosynthesis
MSNCQEAEGEAPNDLVVILLSVFNGARFLREQLTSLSAQTHRNWVLFWRDDGSNDESRRILLEFTEEVGADRVIMLAHPVGAGCT